MEIINITTVVILIIAIIGVIETIAIGRAVIIVIAEPAIIIVVQTSFRSIRVKLRRCFQSWGAKTRCSRSVPTKASSKERCQ